MPPRASRTAFHPVGVLLRSQRWRLRAAHRKPLIVGTLAPTPLLPPQHPGITNPNHHRHLRAHHVPHGTGNLRKPSPHRSRNGQAPRQLTRAALASRGGRRGARLCLPQLVRRARPTASAPRIRSTSHRTGRRRARPCRRRAAASRPSGRGCVLHRRHRRSTLAPLAATAPDGGGRVIASCGWKFGQFTHRAQPENV